MTGERSRFLDLQPLKGGTVAFGGNQQGHIAGIGKVGKNNLTTIDNVFYVKGLKHNLLSISQFCDSGYSVTFNKDSCVIRNSDQTVLFTAARHNNLYKVDLDELNNQSVTCLYSSSDERWLWHRRVGHINLKHLSKLQKLDLVKGLPKISFKSDLLCDACQQGKQHKTSFK